MFDLKQYHPNAPETIALFKAAAQKAGLPESWADDDDLHWLLGKESNGWVGKPNYTIPGFGDQAKWPGIWKRLRAGEVWTKSTATGLGQLLTDNAKKHYPDGLKGIGDAFNEAVGMLRYIHARYSDPKTARSVYGQSADYVMADGTKRHKGFVEGY